MAAVSLALAVVVIAAVVAHSRTRVQEINIYTGYRRDTHMLLGLVTSETVRPTWIAETLTAGVPPDLAASGWRRVSSFRGGSRVSPHYRFHGAFSQVKQLQLSLDAGAATGQAREQIARDLLLLWQRAERYHEADDYVNAVADVLFQHLDKASAPAEPEDLPDPP